MMIFVTKQEFNEGLQKLEDKAVHKELKDMLLEQNMHIQKHRDIDGRLDRLESVTAGL